MEKELNKAYEALNDEFELKKLKLENNELKQQLAEKKKENNELVFIVEEIEQFAWEQLNNENLDKYEAYDEMLTKIKQLTRQSSYEEKHQEKTEFAIKKLEQVKEHFINIKNTTLGVIRRADMMIYLNNLIEELKKEQGSEQSPQKTETASKV